MKKNQYLKKKDLADKDINSSIVGYIKLKDVSNIDNTDSILNEIENKNIILKKNKKGNCIGYIETSDNKLIGICKKNSILIILSIITVILILAVLLVTNSKTIANLFSKNQDENTEIEDFEKIKNINGVDFPNYSLTPFQVDESHPDIIFENPETNNVLFEYLILDDRGRAIYITPLIEPGERDVFNATYFFEKGSHEYTLEINTLTPDTQIILDVYMNPINIEVK